MQTYSHFLMTAALNRGLIRRGTVPVRSWALLLGSVLPDLPLFLLTIGFFAYRQWVRPDLLSEFVFGSSYDALYFTNPFWISGHNLLHAPPLIALYLALGYWGTRHGRGWGPSLIWFAVGCGLHSLVDILTHHNDGPLLLFPFNWSLRFHSPVSYWERAYYAGIVAPLEHLMDLLIVGSFGVTWLRRSRAGARSGQAP